MPFKLLKLILLISVFYSPYSSAAPSFPKDCGNGFECIKSSISFRAVNISSNVYRGSALEACQDYEYKKISSAGYYFDTRWEAPSSDYGYHCSALFCNYNWPSSCSGLGDGHRPILINWVDWFQNCDNPLSDGRRLITDWSDLDTSVVPSRRWCVYSATGPSIPLETLGPPGCEVGNPCDPSTGNKYQRETDYTAKNNGLSFVRHYNSGLTAVNSGMGYGWTHRGDCQDLFLSQNGCRPPARWAGRKLFFC